ncbi:MAG: ELM1/GtrOC1 family putative glycosyltransferase [Reyranellaceae bacterium]
MPETDHPTDAPSRAGPPIWALMAEKPGDNAQIEAVANAAGLPWQRRTVVVQEQWRLAKPPIAVDISHIDAAAGDPLEPPWPDMVITAGRRLFNVALWIKARSPATRLVLVGRPHGRFEACDLIVAAPQFRLPPRDNVVNLSLPLLFPAADRIAAEAEKWRAELAGMARPLTAVLVGAQTQPFRFAPDDARRMMRLIATTNAGAGSLFVTTSRRTPPAVAEAIAASLSPADRLFRWQADAARNPYLALLGLADRFVVTGDSASMLTEVARLGRPLAICELPPDPRPSLWPQHLARALGAALHRLAGEEGARAILQRLRLGGSRDLTALHRKLYAMGRAVKLGQPYPAPAPAGLDDELARVASRIRQLLPPR